MAMSVTDQELNRHAERVLWRFVAKVVLAMVTLVLIGSMGGQMLLPILLPAHLWAARSSGAVGRVLWSLPLGIGVGVMVWALTYTLVGEVQPAIWLAPLLAGVLAAGGIWSVAAPAHK